MVFCWDLLYNKFAVIGESKMEKRNPNDLLILGASILLLGILLMTYSISTYRETKSLEDKIDFEEIDNNNSMSSSDKYFKYLSIADFLNQKLKKNEGLLMKNSSCAYLDYAQHNALALYRLTYSGMETDEARKSVAAGNIRNLYSMLDNYKTCKQSNDYKKELGDILTDIQKTDDLYSQRQDRMNSFMNDYQQDSTQQQASPQQPMDEQQPIQTPMTTTYPMQNAQPVVDQQPVQAPNYPANSTSQTQQPFEIRH